MNDEQFIGYCETHCRTERALFSGAQVNRLEELAGVQPATLFANNWYTMRANYAQPLVDEARRRMREAAERALHENVLARGFVEGDLG
jgi:hypothetical protein